MKIPKKLIASFLIGLSVFTANAEYVLKVKDDVSITQKKDKDNPSDEIVIKNPTIEQLKEILDFDYKVTFEFFKPLYIKHYSHFEFGKNPDFYLEQELKADQEYFQKCINSKGDERLLIAYNNRQKCVAGLIYFQKNDHVLNLELLLVGKEYRNKGIGKKLVSSAIGTFPDIKECVVYPVRFGNENTLKFYESLGFVNLGFGPKEKKNAYGVSYEDMHFYYKLFLKK